MTPSEAKRARKNATEFTLKGNGSTRVISRVVCLSGDCWWVTLTDPRGHFADVALWLRDLDRWIVR